MNKKVLFMAIAAMLAMTSCTVEAVIETAEDDSIVESEQEPLIEYEPMTFYATIESDETKTYLSGTSILWAGDESIAIFDHDAGGAANKFDVESAGATTSFSGTVPVGTTHFTAVYPYRGDIVYEAGAGSPITTFIPAIQEATLNSFDPASALFVATATKTNTAMTFTPAFALFKVEVDVDNVVQITLSTSSNNLAGSVLVSRGGALANGPGDLSKTITLKHSDGRVLEAGHYYIVTRFLKESQSFPNFTMKYMTSDAKIKSRVSVDGIPYAVGETPILGRKDILDLGKLSSVPGEGQTSWYDYYQAGYSVTVGSKSFNKADDGDATLISSTEGAKNISSTINGKDAVFFLDAAGGSFNLNANVTVSTGNLVLINNSGNEAILTTANKQFALNGGNVYLKGLSINAAGRTGNGFFNNSGAAKSSNYVAMDGCAVSGIAVDFCRFTTSDYPALNYEFVNNSFAVSKDGNSILFNLSDITSPSAIKSFVFKNNLVYDSTGSSHIITVLSSKDYTPDTYTFETVFSNNLLINAPSQSAYTTVFTDVTSLTFDNNIFYEGNDYDSDCYLFDVKNTSSSVVEDKVSISGNKVIGLGSSIKWYYVNALGAGTIKVISDAYGGTNEIAKTAASDVFDTVPSVTDGVVTYALKPAYADRGPQ